MPRYHHSANNPTRTRMSDNTIGSLGVNQNRVQPLPNRSQSVRKYLPIIYCCGGGAGASWFIGVLRRGDADGRGPVTGATSRAACALICACGSSRLLSVTDTVIRFAKVRAFEGSRWLETVAAASVML